MDSREREISEGGVVVFLPRVDVVLSGCAGFPMYGTQKVLDVSASTLHGLDSRRTSSLASAFVSCHIQTFC